MPDLTPAQIVAALGAVGAQAVAYKLLAGGTEQLVVSVAGIVVPAAFMIGDAIIRHGRAKISVAQIEADVQKLVALLAHHSQTHAFVGVTVEDTKASAAAAIAQASSS